jgi:hypothetical protein
LVTALSLISIVRYCPIVNAELINNNNTDNSVGLKIPLPFNFHIADQTIDDGKIYIDNIQQIE